MKTLGLIAAIAAALVTLIIVNAPPLPALFLRETAEFLRRNPAPLYLFLSSDFPINDANKFTGLQERRFAEIKCTGDPQLFLDPEIGFHTAMFSDIASAQACVACHNTEPDSPKTDWQVGNIMGATTWSYPEVEIGMTEGLASGKGPPSEHPGAYEHYLA